MARLGVAMTLMLAGVLSTDAATTETNPGRTATEQLLSHFTPIATDDFEQHVGVELPICRANDGWTMLEQMREALGTERAGA